MTDRLYTDTELADRYGKGKAFVQAQCRAKAWPHLRVGKSFRFTADHVAAIDAQLEVSTATPGSMPAPGVENPWGRKGRSA